MSYNYADSATISAGASDLKLASDSYVSYTPDYQTLVMSGNGSDMGVAYTNITVDSGGHAQFANRACVSAMTISSGGSADFATTWCMVKDLTVKDGGVIKFTNGKLAGSSFDIAVGGIDGCAAAYASGDTFYDYDNSLNIDLWDGVKFERATIRGTVSATSNTAVSSSIVTGLLALRASSFAADITVNGGTARIDQGATLQNATFNGGYISSLDSGLLKGTITGGTVTGGTISATAGAKISGTTVTGGTLQAINSTDAATFDSTTVNGGNLIVRSAGNLATNLSVVNGIAYIQNGASASSASVTGGQLIVHNDSYASAADITVNGGKLRVQNGALVTGVTLTTGNVSANTGGRVVGATINGGTLSATDSASVENATVNGGTLQAPDAGTVVSFKNITVNGGTMIVNSVGNSVNDLKAYGGVAYIQTGASGSKLEVASSGILYIVGGTATEIIANGGSGRVQGAGASATGVTVNAGGDLSACITGKITDATVNGGQLCAITTATIESAVVNGGALNAIQADGSALIDSATVAGSNGMVVVRFATNRATNLTVAAGEAYIQSGASANKMTVTGGTLYALYDGTSATDATVTGGLYRVDFNAKASGAWQNGGTVSVGTGAELVDLTVSGGSVVVNSGTLRELVVEGANVNVSTYNSALVESAVIRGGRFDAAQANGGVTFNSTTVDGGTMVVRHATNRATDTTLLSGTVYIQSSATASKMTVVNGTLSANNSAKIEDITLSGGILYARDSHAWIDNTTVYGGTMQVDYATNSVTNLKVSGGLAYLQAGASGSGIEIAGSGIFYMVGGTATDLTANGGSARVQGDGALATGVTVNAGGDLSACVEGKITGATVNGGTLNAVTTGTIESAVVNGGYLQATQANGNALLAGATAAGGTVIVRSATNRATDLTVESGEAYIQSGASASATTVTGGVFYALNDGTTVENTVVSAGSMRVQDYGTASGTVLEGGTMTARSATFIDLEVRVGASAQFLNNVTLSGSIDIASGAAIYMGGDTVAPLTDVYTSNGAVHNLAIGVNSVILSGLVASSLSVSSAGRIIAYDTTIYDLDVDANGTDANGQLYMSSGTVISRGTVDGRYGANAVYMLDGARFASATVVNGNIFVTDGGGSLTDLVQYDGQVILRGTEAGISGAEVSGGGLYIQNGAAANGIAVNGGKLVVQETDASPAGKIETVNNVTMTTGQVEVSSGGTINGLSATGGTVYVLSSGTVNVQTGGALNDLQAAAGAKINFVENKTVATFTGENTNIAEGTLYFNNTAVAGHAASGVLEGFNADNSTVGYKLSIGSGIVLKNAVGNNAAVRVSCFDGAVVSGITLRGGAIICVQGADARVYDATLTGEAETCNLNLSGGAYASNTVVQAGAKIQFQHADAKADNTTIMAGGSMVMTAAADTGDRVTLDFTGTTGNQSVYITNMNGIKDTTEILVLGVEAGNTYTFTTGSATDRTVTCGDYRIYDLAVKGGKKYSNAFLGLNFDFLTGKALTVSEFSVGSQTTAAELTTANATELADGGLATKWTTGTDVSTLPAALAGANTTGDAWLTLDGANLATALYGAEGNFAHDVNLWLYEGTVRNLAAGATAGGSVANVNLMVSDSGENNTGLTFSGTAYAGGFGSVTGEVNTALYAGTFQKDFYAGALANKLASATSVGDITTTVAGGEFSGNIYGASAVKTTANASGTVHTAGDVTLTVTGGSTTKGGQACIFAGGYATGDATGTVYTVDSVSATISGGSWGTAAGGRGVFGGIFANKVTAQVIGAVNITISGDATFGNVYGGGWAQNGGHSAVGDVNISITGGTIQNVFGGGTHSSNGSNNTTEAGAVTITVSGGTINGDIYARGQSEGDSTGAASVTFTGANDFNCGVWGYSRVPESTNYIEEATATAALSFNDYTGTFGGKIGGFDGGITLNGATAMTFGTAASVNNSAWEFDLTGRDASLSDTSLLTWSGADFENDTVKVAFADETQAKAGWNIAEAAFDGATFDLYIGGSEITSVAYDTAISGGDWDGWKFTSVDGTLKFAKLA